MHTFDFRESQLCFDHARFHSRHNRGTSPPRLVVQIQSAAPVTPFTRTTLRAVQRGIRMTTFAENRTPVERCSLRKHNQRRSRRKERAELEDHWSRRTLRRGCVDAEIFCKQSRWIFQRVFASSCKNIISHCEVSSLSLLRRINLTWLTFRQTFLIRPIFCL